MKKAPKPATALPWERSDRAFAGSKHGADIAVSSESGEAVATAATHHCGGVNAEENALYIAHAANAYPKLVGALRHLLDTNCATCPTAEAITEARALARHVLRQLGEAE